MIIHMRTNIVLDDELVNEAMRASGIRTKKELVNHALRVLVEKENESLRRARYDLNVLEIQQRTSHLKMRESAHSLIRADRERV